MREENQTILKEDLNNPKRRKALFNQMQAMQ